MMNTRVFVGIAKATAAALIFSGVVRAGDGAVPPASEGALARLREGNERFVSGHTLHPDQSAERRAELAKGQKPIAVILSCSDSRVVPELLFDQGLGDLFVIRNAGNVLDDHVLGSIEYAVEHLHASLVVVLGHSHCGAVTAAVSGGEAPGHLRSIVESLSSSASMGRKKPGDAIENAVRINAKLSAAALAQTEPLLREESAAHRLLIIAARYDLATGQVEFLP